MKITTDRPNVIFMSFADNKIPEFRESKSRDWVLYGEDNNFPTQLLYLFNKSSNHNSIINGKVCYILGRGFIDNRVVNSKGETVNSVFKKLITDIELFGGCRVECIYKFGGGLEISHLPFQKLRRGKDNQGFWFANDWTKISSTNRPKFIPDYDPTTPVGSQVFYYNEYRPGCDIYPLPSYFGALNDIETDVEISKYNLSVIKNGMFSSKMLVFKDGQPTQEIQSGIERGFKTKFAGSENAGNFMLVFQKPGAVTPEVVDLSSTDLDKLFDQLNKTTQAEIFSGHQVTSPTLFGIMEPGKLGGRSELQDSYEIFKNTYVNNKQQAVEEIAKVLFPLLGITNTELTPVDPLSIQLNPVDFKDMLPEEWVFEKLGIDPIEYGVAPTSPTSPTDLPVNENLKNLTGRQMQQLQRVLHKYKNKKITKLEAELLLSSSYGLTTDSVSKLLGADNFSAVYNEDDVAMMFSEIGEPRGGYLVAKSMHFSKAENFADLSKVDANIVDLIRKDKRISIETIAEITGTKKDYIGTRVSQLIKEGVLSQSTKVVGTDKIIETAINPEVIDYKPKAETINMYVKYSYEVKPGAGAEIIPTTRPFCKKLIELDRLYTRQEIENISQRLGYSVFDRSGGWWGDSYQCRHEWRRNLVIKKN